MQGVAAAVAGRAGRGIRNVYARARWGRDLPALAAYFGTDKW
jgi:hypothetical protein